MRSPIDCCIAQLALEHDLLLIHRDRDFEAEAHDDYWVAGLVQDFTEKLARVMESGKVSRSELARRLGTSPAYITKILRGNTNFTLATMVRLARALGAEASIELRRAGAAEKRVEAKHSPLSRSAAARTSADIPIPASAAATLR